MHAIQATRRDEGFDISDRIVLGLDRDPKLLDATRTHQDYVSTETLAVEVRYETLPRVTPALIDGIELRIAVVTAAA